MKNSKLTNSVVAQVAISVLAVPGMVFAQTKLDRSILPIQVMHPINRKH
ncbi:hypothetical protein KA005_18845 [bacterium]|nr:hypothetical protein [bacterium]